MTDIAVLDMAILSALQKSETIFGTHFFFSEIYGKFFA